MGSVIYDFFSESMLSHKDSIAECFKNETIERLEKELVDYRQFCIDNFSSIIREIIEYPSALKTFTSIDLVPKQLLMQTALYLDQCVLPDPLFKHTEKKGSQAFSEYLGFQKSELNKEDIAKTCKYLNDILPMVVGDFVKFFPLSYYFERPVVPMYGPDHYFKDILPPNVLSFFQASAKVRPMSKLSSGGWAIIDKELEPCRAISVEMEGDEWHRGMVYFLVESEVIAVDEKEHTVTWRQVLPDTPPDPTYFDRWVDQSTRSVAKNYFDAIYFENRIASDLNATYLTNNGFTGKLIDTALNPRDSIEIFTANQVLNIDLPFLDKINVDKLMQVRINDAEVFTSFRLELEKGFRELRTTQDEKQLKLKAENIFHELNEVQGLKIKRKLDHLVKQVSVNSVLAAGGLSASFATGGASLFATLFAIIKGYKDYQDYKEKATETPGYFLWKVKDKKK
jgi:hypothetical protein